MTGILLFLLFHLFVNDPFVREEAEGKPETETRHTVLPGLPAGPGIMPTSWNHKEDLKTIRMKISPTSLVRRDNPPLQKIDLMLESGKRVNDCMLEVWSGEKLMAQKSLGPVGEGSDTLEVFLPEPVKAADTRWLLKDGPVILCEERRLWEPPRHWKLYVIKSAHTDIGLHDPQYKQRLMGVHDIDTAQVLAERTAGWPEASRYRYVIEGLWWWQNYTKDRSGPIANEVMEKYIKTGIFGIGASHSGNHTQVFSPEELCRSIYYAQEMRDRWGLDADAMIMADNNGISWPLVTVYADAGIRYLGFFPNTWNPNSVGKSRIDVGWESALPHLFYWQGPGGENRMLIWANPHYTTTGTYFGFQTSGNRNLNLLTPESVAPKMAKQLTLLEMRYPYDIWLIPNYSDNEPPGLTLPEFAKKWNNHWLWPELRTTGNLSEPFREVEQKFGKSIPALSGMITGGWAQHPLSTPYLFSRQRQADRLLPTAEKLATLACLADSSFIYPSIEFKRAWDALISNDEHGYGVSNYKGRPVYDTWMQKIDWIGQALATAEKESSRALKALAAQVPAENPSVFIFNPTLQTRKEMVDIELPENCKGFLSVRLGDGSLAPAAADGEKLSFCTGEIPPLGYVVCRLEKGEAGRIKRNSSALPPTVENSYYRVAFNADGSINTIFDKQLGRELTDKSASCRCNQFVYTGDAHKTYTSPAGAKFETGSSPLGQTIIAVMDDPVSGAAIEQRVFLPSGEKRIDIDNRLNHVTGLSGKNRYLTFGYYAFPFDIPGGSFKIGLNGCDADPYKDQTGHGTDAYHAAGDWVYAGNGKFGISLVQYDSHLVEFGKIHALKNSFGENPDNTTIYSALFNDWLYGQAWTTGPSYINLRYRYSITSMSGEFRESQVPGFAERMVTPVSAMVIPAPQKGTLPAHSYSFLSVDNRDISLLTLKLSETPGQGVIARFHRTDNGPEEQTEFRIGWGKELRVTNCSVTEQNRNILNHRNLLFAPFEFKTVRIEEAGIPPPSPEGMVSTVTDKSVTFQWMPVRGARHYYIFRGDHEGFNPDSYHLAGAVSNTKYTDDWLKAGNDYFYRIAAVDDKLRVGAISEEIRATTLREGDSPPAMVGSVFTGLISAPRAWKGDTPDILYLQWGQNQETDLSHYELFRSESPEFKPDKTTFLSDVEPGPYITVPYEDKGLKPHTTYYYQVRAVDNDGNRGSPCPVFKGITREP